MRESRIMLLHYVTGALILISAATHLALHSFTSLTYAPAFGDKADFHVVLANYENVLYAATLELLLVTAALHGLNGVRVVALEWRQGPRWTRLVSWGVTLLGIAVIALGTYTILVVRSMTAA